MDGREMHGTPWIDSPVQLHSYRQFECQFNETWRCDYEQGYWRFWYEADHRYALPTVALFCTGIIVFAIGHFFNQLKPRSLSQTRVIRRIIALNRFLSYRVFRIQALNWNSAPLGLLALAAVGATYFFSMTLAPKPYYWQNTETINYGNSPPIATRSGWLSLGCMPFVFATAGKSNFITAVTGVSHEKLQVFHRWISYAFFVTALVHTFPFIVYNIKMGQMVEQWDTSVTYWTGVVALIAQAWLTFASFSPLRSLCYEWFKFSHFVAALVFMLFLFFHCDHTLSSWDYFIATGVLFSLSWLHRQIRIYFEHGIGKHATVRLASNGFICVRVPTRSVWGVGQHFFVRFLSLGLHAWTIHPFTACSLPQRVSAFDQTESELIFYIRPRSGFTARLARYAESHPNGAMRVLLDGPYGGISMQKLQQSQRQLVIAGGSGAGWIMPMITTFLRRQELEGSLGKASEPLHTRVVLATRDTATRGWFEDAISELLATSGFKKMPHGLEVDLYYTGSEENAEASKVIGQFRSKLGDPEKIPDTENSLIPLGSDSDNSSDSWKTGEVKCFNFRPDLPSLVRSEAAQADSHGQLGVFVCGPLSMQSDVSNAVPSEQLGILKGGLKDIYLHMEHFSWA